MNGKPLVVQGTELSAPAERWLAERCRIVKVPASVAALGPALTEADGLIVRSNVRVDSRLIAGARILRVIGSAGVGVDHIDVAACRKRQVEVVYAPDSNTQAVVEYAITVITDALRSHPPLHAVVTDADWNQSRRASVATRQMNERTLGILGLGRIGRRLSRVATAIGFRVLYHDLLDIPPAARAGATPVTLERLVRESDVVSIHVDGRSSNRRLVDENFLRFLKEDVFLVNTSRGFVVDKAAVAEFLRAHPNAHAHLDVHDPEPIDAAYPLLDLPNATLTPHLASRTERAMLEMSWVVRDVVAVLNGVAPRHPVPELE